MNFINLPVAFRGRRLIQVPCGIIQPSTRLNAGYDSDLDATMAELPYVGGKFSLILILPGKQTEFIAGGLSRIESRLNSTLWNGLLRRMSPHNIDFKMPFFRHRTVINNLKDAFESLEMKSAFSQGEADFSGVNGGRDLWMSEIIQLNEVKIEPGDRTKTNQGSLESTSSFRSAGRYRSYRQARQLYASRQTFSRQDDANIPHEHGDEDNHHDHHAEHSQNHDHHADHHNHHGDEVDGQQNQSTVRIYFERQFMYAIRHNPTGMLIYIGRYYQPEEAVSHEDHHSGHSHH